ncbi:diacylglycerol kinase alpha [Capsaspora owczarzaki ATCC 30864]|uniref:Diacylglycerol kinase n=2 Tax=Capsaspora owczarzaki (strain ATCC 30864) TaxID=595528 RepID=A0A0D2VH33_CAPO3|nr:diacylglycerol kinase alpha [Capsaspora owczarzaki ATCC 30864]
MPILHTAAPIVSESSPNLNHDSDDHEDLENDESEPSTSETDLDSDDSLDGSTSDDGSENDSDEDEEGFVSTPADAAGGAGAAGPSASEVASMHANLSTIAPTISSGPFQRLRNRRLHRKKNSSLQDVLAPEAAAGQDANGAADSLANAAEGGGSGGRKKKKSLGPSLSLREAINEAEHNDQQQHIWYPKEFGKVAYCNVCRKMVGFKKGFKCSACRIVVDHGCRKMVNRAIPCRAKFTRESNPPCTTAHHFVEGNFGHSRCTVCKRACGAAIAMSLAKPSSAAVRCSWCKTVAHMSCTEKLPSDCNFGEHANIILPPSAIRLRPEDNPESITVPQTRAEKKSLKKDLRRKSIAEISKRFHLEIPSNIVPLLVFINPKSGGKQGVKLMQIFQWLLNPMQVFDLTQGGPAAGLKLFANVANYRILVCGGDGTVGWVLSAIDNLQLNPRPPVAVLPLGTGNDLARALRWGGGYSDELISPILERVEHAEIVKLDRWNLEVTPHGERVEGAALTAPLDVINNYFSFGADAKTALAFHQAREKNPDRFKSRIGNKMFYGMVGGVDIFKHSMKDLSKVVQLQCDGVDYTPLLRMHKLEGICLLNITSYAGGTNPWGTRVSEEFKPQQFDDGLIEVIGIENALDLAIQQARLGSGLRICQCRQVTVTTLKELPVQVDGEPCLLGPSIIRVNYRNQSSMLRKVKKSRSRSNSVEGVGQVGQIGQVSSSSSTENTQSRLATTRSASQQNLSSLATQSAPAAPLPSGTVEAQQSSSGNQSPVMLSKQFRAYSSNQLGSGKSLSQEVLF